MITKNYIYFAFICSLFAGPAFAESFHSGPYIGYAMSHNLGDAARPEVSPTHPVDFTHSGDHNFGVGRSITAGYIWSPWYAEAGWLDLGAVGRSNFQSGEDATFTFSTSAEREEEVTGGVIKLGRWFSFSNRYAAYIEAGALWFKSDVTTSTISTQTEKPSGPTTITAISSSGFTERDTATMYGVGIAVIASDASRLVLAFSRYDEVDRTSISVGVQIGF